MFIKRIYLILIFLTFTPLITRAQQDSVIISGELRDSLKEGNTFTCKVIRPGAPLFGQTAFCQSFNAVVIKGHFRLAIPSSFNWFDVTFSSYDTEGNQTFYNNGNPLETTYLLEKGDQIKMVIQPEGLIDFFGKAALRLTCQENIYMIGYLPESVQFTVNYLFRKEKYVDGYNYDLKFLAQQIKMKQTILEAYRDSLPAPVYKRFYADIFGQSYKPLLHVLNLPYKDTLTNIGAKTVWPLLIATMPSPDTSKEAIGASSYADIWLDKAVNEIAFSGSGRSKKVTFSDLFTLVSHEYTGALRDKVILLVFLNYARKDPNSVNYLDKAYQVMENDESKRLLQEWAINHLKGAPAFAFDLPSETGKRFKLNNFRGKIIVADFWFYGCEGCLGIPPAMSEVWKKYANNDRVVFLSINVDRAKKTWENGLKSGRYTIPGSIHLSLMGLGTEHDFIKFYGYDSYPQLLVIGPKGEIISAYPPDPRIDKGKELIKLIDSELY